MQKWSTASVRDLLPSVRVRVDNIVKVGYVVGRHLPFARVVVGDRSWDFAWRTIADCLNRNSVLLVD